MTVPRRRLPGSSGNALVLAGGGVAGIAWELGVLCGIADADPALAGRVLAANLVVGTSAGASVAAQITCGVPLDELYAAQLRPETAEIEVDFRQGQALRRLRCGHGRRIRTGGRRPSHG